MDPDAIVSGVRTPTLRLHHSGLWMAKWGGRTYYFGRERAAAERDFANPRGAHPGSMVRWMTWRQRSALAGSGPRRRIAELARDFLGHYHADGRRDTERYYRLHLRRFLAVLGRLYADELDDGGLAAFRADLASLPLAPKTIAHDLRAIGTLLRWCHDHHHVGTLNLRLLRPPRVPRSTPEPITVRQIRSAIARCQAAEPQLAPWLTLNYLCLLRPSEVVRIAHGQARLAPIPAEAGPPRRRAIPDALLILDQQKTAASGAPRLIPVSPEALVSLRSLAPLPLTRLRQRTMTPSIHYLANRYAAATRAAGEPGLPHKLRDSAATHLLHLGVERGTVDLLLGHAPKGELSRYGQASLQLLHRSASRLTLG